MDQVEYSKKSSNDQIVLGLDIGGSKTEVLVIDRLDNQLSYLSQPTLKARPQEFFDGTTFSIKQAINQAGKTEHQIAGIGVAMAGLIAAETGVVTLAVNLGLDSFPLGPRLSQAFNAPVAIENDVRAAALGAFNCLRHSNPINSLAYLSIGTGISAGIVLDGQLYRGVTGMAGEIGHVVIDPLGPRCNCGQRGCLEAMAAGPAIARLGKEMMKDMGGKKMSAADVYRAAKLGSQEAETVVKQISRYLARAIQMLIMAYDVQKVALGGGVTKNGTAFLDPVLGELDRIRDESKLAENMLTDDKIILITPEFSPGIWGAVALAKRSLMENELS